jgi:hypothetical protein
VAVFVVAGGGYCASGLFVLYKSFKSWTHELARWGETKKLERIDWMLLKERFMRADCEGMEKSE